MVRGARGGKSGDRRPNWNSLNLQAEQKAQIKAIREASKLEIKAILTPTQLQEFNQRGDRRGNPKNQ